MSGPIYRWLHRHDPEWYALHKAIKVAFAVTVGLAIGTLIGNSQLSLFASFGGVALLLFADFPGSTSARLGAYLGLTVVGALLITLGTLASRTPWLAVLGMAAVGFAVLFGGVLSAAAAGATRAALLTFILPVTVPATAAEIGPRLAGWGLAVVLAIPAAILVWPPRDHDKLRDRAAQACAALAAQLSARSAMPGDDGPAQPITSGPSTTDADANTQQAVLALRRQFRSTTYRPVGLTTGSRLLMSLTDRLEWLRAVVDRVPAGTADRWSPHIAEMVSSCEEVLVASADVLAHPAHRPTYATRQRLATALRELEKHGARVASFRMVVADGPVSDGPVTDGPATDGPATDGPVADGPATDEVIADGGATGGPGPVGMPPAVAHELVYTTRLVGHTIAVSATADARPLIDRLLGRQAPSSVDGSIAAAHRIIAGHVTRGSVWFQNSLRGALGLSIAVLLAEITEIQHGFWIVLGAMSVLRTTALTTGSTALRAMTGTVVGFVAGAGILFLVGVTPWHLWVLLPFVVLIAAYLPEAVSFVAGQAAFTVMVVILFNIIQPVGWTVGLVRIEDIGLGCLAGLISGVLLWPHGAAAQIRSALSDYYRRSADALEAATRWTSVRAVSAVPGIGVTATGIPGTGIPAPDTGTLGLVMSETKAAGLRLDDAFREYLFERGTKEVPVAELTAVVNGASRVRLAAEAIAGMTNPIGLQVVTPDDGTGAHPTTGSPHTAATAVTAAEVGLSESGSTAAGWFRGIADVLDRPAEPLPAITPAVAQDRVLRAFRSDLDAVRDADVAAVGTSLWSASLYVDDVTRLQKRLIGSVVAFNSRTSPGAPEAEDDDNGPVDGRSPVGTRT